jgi:hypothetical protein
MLRSMLILTVTALALAVLISRATGPRPGDAPTATRAQPDPEPGRLGLIERGSTEVRLRVLEAQLFELRARIEATGAPSCSDLR